MFPQCALLIAVLSSSGGVNVWSNPFFSSNLDPLIILAIIQLWS